MGFPTYPFSLGETADQELIQYLQDSGTFEYIQSAHSGIRELHLDDLRGQYKKLKELWPLVLTDALRELKKHDPREWPEGKDFSSFFHEHSLGVAELQEVFTGFTEFEGMLYGVAPDRYRDHLAHAFRVWIIGHGLLNNCFQGELNTDELDKSITRREWEGMWAIAALCHDVGYPLAAIERINQQARTTLRSLGLTPAGDLRFAFSQQMLPFHDTIIKLISSKPVKISGKERYLTHLQNKYYLKFLKSFDRLDHGIVSTLLISKALVYFLESDLSHDSRKPLGKEDARQFLIRREILRGIAAHTCPDIYHLSFTTISFLLFIVDELQCWGRPTLEELQSDSEIRQSTAHIKEFTRSRIDIQIDTDDENWDEGQRKGVVSQINRLHRLLRLAVDMPARAPDLYLKFSIKNKCGEKGEFLLEDNDIKVFIP
jgi:hypothetical protein